MKREMQAPSVNLFKWSLKQRLLGGGNWCGSKNCSLPKKLVIIIIIINIVFCWCQSNLHELKVKGQLYRPKASLVNLTRCQFISLVIVVVVVVDKARAEIFVILWLFWKFYPKFVCRTSQYPDLCCVRYSVQSEICAN